VSELILDAKRRAQIDMNRYVNDTVGLPTLQDIMAELEKPGRDPREAIEVWSFDERIRIIEDVKAGMVLPGVVTNVTNFGCFVDIGVKENGLVHVSQLADRYVSDPTTIVSVHQHVTVRVLEVDYERKRISLSMKNVE
jgi:uncharacterized protein